MKIDTDDLVDPTEAAVTIGLSHANGVSTYRGRYNDFPTPVIERGKCVLWLRKDIVRWADGHQRRRGPKPGSRRP